MSSIPAIISDLEYSRSDLLRSIEGLSQREMTRLEVYPGWTIKDVLAHVVNWDERVIKILPLILQNRASEVPGVEVEEHNREAVEAWQDRPLADVLAAIKMTHRQILEMISQIDHKEIDLRRDRRGRPITIRSYVIAVMAEHERQHAAEIRLWRKELEQAIDPEPDVAALAKKWADFKAVLEGLAESEALDKSALGQWSVKDVVGHMADWEWRMLGAARHIYDPSLPEVPPLAGSEDYGNELLASRREANSWSQELEYWQKTIQAVEDFVAKLKPADWRLRGPYPWADDQGTIAELVWHMAEHYDDHLPHLKQWRWQRRRLPPEQRPWIRWKLDGEATGPLKQAYTASIRSSDRVWHIIRLMSLRPSTLLAAMRLYTSTVRQPTQLLGQPEREMIGVVVAQLNGCVYCVQSGLYQLRQSLSENLALVDRFAENWRSAGLPEHVQAALGFAEKLTLQPGQMSQEDIRTLRRKGYSDEEIHDMTQITAFFNYITRVANALGAPPEDFMQPWPREDGDWR